MNKLTQKQAVIDYLIRCGTTEQKINDFQKTVVLSDDIYIDKDGPSYDNFKDHVDNHFDYYCWRLENGVDFDAEEDVRPGSSELYNYEPVRTFGDVVLCPRCNNGDIGDGQRVCSICINEINADDFA